MAPRHFLTAAKKAQEARFLRPQVVSGQFHAAHQVEQVRQVSHRPAPLLTTRQAADYLQVPCPRGVYRRIREQGLPFRRVGGRLRFKQEELDAWMTSHRQQEAEAMRLVASLGRKG
jgi:excisionase family DNA binding protein